jgi:hypothetical protein
MKKKIIDFLKYDRTYEGAVKLYNEFGQRMSLKRHLSNQPESVMSGILFDELRQIADVSPAEYKQILMIPVKTKADPITIPAAAIPSPPPALKGSEKKTASKNKGAKKPVAKKKNAKKPIAKMFPEKKAASSIQEPQIPTEPKK